MLEKDAADLIALLEKNGLEVYVDGGWAVDAVLGEQTRPHDDLDIALPHVDNQPYFVTIGKMRDNDIKLDVKLAELSVDDIKALKDLGVVGVVIGCLTPDGKIDEARTKALVEAARPMKVTCHRAFDMTDACS